MDKSKEEKMLSAIGDIDDELILAADETAGNVVLFPRKRRWQSVALTAACFLLCTGVWFSVAGLFSGKSTSSAAPQAPSAAPPAATNTSSSFTESALNDSVPSEETTLEEEMKEQSQTSITMEPSEPAGQANPTTGGSGMGGSNGISDEAQKYDTYNAPLLPLTAVGDTENILAERQLSISNSTEDTISVQDNYILTNSSAEDKVLTLQYRYGNSLACADVVEMSVDADAEEQTLEISENISTYRSNGSYSEAYESWEAYSQRLNDLDYASNRKTSYNEEESVYVYTISNITLPGGTGNDVQTLISFDGREDGLVLFSGCSGYYVKENGINSYTIYPHSRSDYPLQIISYAEKLDLAVIAVRDNQQLKLRVEYQVDVESMTLREALTKQYRQYAVEEGTQVVKGINEEQITDAILYQLNDLPFYDPDYRNQAIVESTQLIYDTIHGQRLYILEQCITIPAGESVHISVSAEKWPSTKDDVRGIEIIGQEQTVFQLTKTELQMDAISAEHDLPADSGSMELSPTENYYIDYAMTP